MGNPQESSHHAERGRRALAGTTTTLWVRRWNGDEDPAEEEAKEVQGSTIGQLKQVKEKRPFTDEEAESTVAEFMEHQNRTY